MTQHQQATFPIVGIGASAGGLEALKEFVQAVPPDSGIAYVIVQHLAADHPSIMDELLGNHAQIPVRKISDGMAAAPDTVFVIPAGPSLTIEDGIFRLHQRDATPGVRTPIDEFLSSLAEDAGADAFCIILSGTGSDGTLGVRAIKSAGGTAIVQESDSARFPGMPNSANATGLVDFVLKPKAIPDRIIDILRHREELAGSRDSDQIRDDIEASLDTILALIDEENGHDFSQYKTGTLVRRIARRISILRDRNVQAFVNRLEKNPEERTRLLQEFLIGVTRFFRDEEAFIQLNQEAILPLLDRDQDRFRIWVPGCSTGEEAYSLAMLFNEAMTAAGDTRSCQIFGTDIDAAALKHARAGIYSDSQIEQISEKRRETFFVNLDGQHQINPQLRERCVFAPHNLLQDPPFSRIDLISCRNLLIYLNADIQGTVIPRFHYALNRSGYLFLGPSESLGKKDSYFIPLDREARIFQRNDAEPTGYTSLPARNEDGARRRRRLPRQKAAPLRATPPEPDFEQQVTSFFLREFAAPFAVVNANDEISFLSERMGQFIQPVTGTVSSALDQFLARELRSPVRTSTAEVRKTGKPVGLQNIVVNNNENATLVDLEVKPLPFADDKLMIVITPVRTQNAGSLTDSSSERDRSERDIIERELTLTRQQLSLTLTDYEVSEQELRSSNEELLSMNEELQSSNEELETSREELQSINEELETINAELTENNRQLVEANSDLRNLFESTDIATVFLDQTLCVRRYTPAAQRLFGIQERDIGRNICDLKWKVSYDTLEADAEKVSRTLQPIEKEVRIDTTDETFLMRLRPYRRTDNRLDGCVISLIDISLRKRFERQITENAETLERQYAELETLYDTTPVGLCLMDRDLRWMRINESLAEINGYSPEEHIGKTLAELLPDIDDKTGDNYRKVLETGKAVTGIEIHGTTPADPTRERDWIADYFPVFKGDEVFAVGTCVQEVTEQRALQRQVELSLAAVAESEARLRRLFDQAPVFICMHEGDGHKFIYANEAHQNATGNRAVEGRKILEAFPELEGQNIIERYDRVLTSGEGEAAPVFSAQLRDDESGELNERWYTQFLQPWFEPDGSVGGVMSFAFDITEQIEASRALEENNNLLQLAMGSGGMGVWEMDLGSENIEIDATTGNLLGLEGGHGTLTVDRFFDCVHPDDRDYLAERRRNTVEGDQFEAEFRIVRPDGEERWLCSVGDVVFRDGKAVSAVGLIFDVTERRNAAERQNTLLHELQHRVKNTMATTLAIVKFSAKRAENVPAFTETLSERLHAIARTHDLLTASDWKGARLEEVVRQELMPYADDQNQRCRFEGENIPLTAKQMLSLALALHELATNAAKYGALSVEDGTVLITAQRSSDDRALITWEEKNGPKVSPPGEDDSGFGVFLIERVLGSDLAGNVEIDYAESGVVCRIEFPLY